MEKQYTTTSATPHVLIDVAGDLRLKGQEEFEVVAKTDSSEDITFESLEDQVTIRCRSDCNIRVPRASIVQVQAARGDAVIKALDGELNISEVSGDLELRDVGSTVINSVRGDLVAKNVDGNLTIETVSGELTVRSVQGDFGVNGSARGNLNVSDVGGSARASADGNVVLRLDPAPGHSYEFKARGNIFCRLPDDTSVEISVPKAAQVMVDLPGIHATAPVQTPYALTVGEGDAHLILSANGNVVLDTHAPDWDMEDFDFEMDSELNGMADIFSQQINQQVDSQVRMIEDQLNAQLSSLTMRLNASQLSEEQARRIEERAREASERATVRAQERVRRAQERMEQKFAAAQRKMEHKAQKMERASRQTRHGWNFNVSTTPNPATPAGEPVSEDERLMILRMLEQKKISMEEAEQLLSALEAKS